MPEADKPRILDPLTPKDHSNSFGDDPKIRIPSVGFLHHLKDGAFYIGHLFIGIDLLPVKVTDIEHIDDLVDFGTDFCHPHIEFAPKEGIGNQEQKPRKIIGIDFDDGKKAGSPVIDHHAMGPAR